MLEAGVGSGALSCSLLRAVGRRGSCGRTSCATTSRRWPAERELSAAGRRRRPPTRQPSWHLHVGDVADNAETGFDRIILDMLTPWAALDMVERRLLPGGVFIGYVATTPQLSELVEALRERGGFTEPLAWESLVRDWHADGLAVRPDHRMIAHTAFLVRARKLAPGVTAPPRRRKPSKGAEAYDCARRPRPPTEAPDAGAVADEVWE